MENTLKMKIDSARAEIHNLQCRARTLKRLFETEAEVSFDEYETEDVFERLDEIFIRLENLSHKLAELDPPSKEPQAKKVVPLRNNGSRLKNVWIAAG